MQGRKRDDRDMALVERIALAMKAAGLNMVQLAERTGIRYGTLRAYMAGDRAMPARLVPGVAAALDVSADWLLSGKPLVPHPYALLIAVAGLTQILRARPDDDPSLAYGELMSSLYLTYKREYLNRFRDPAHVHMSSAEVHEEAAVLKRLYELGGSPRKL